MSLEVKPSTIEDTPHLLRWLNDPRILCWFPMESEKEIEDSVRIWMNYATMGGSFTVFLDSVAVGMSTLYLQPYQKVCHQALFSIVIEDCHRGKGIGTFLLKNLIELAKTKHHIELLHLEVYQGNPAVGLYRKMGFKEYGVHPKFIKIDGKYVAKHLMQKEL